MAKAPEIIWASEGETWDGIEEGLSWDEGLFNRYQQYAFEIEYIRKDKYDDLKKAADYLAYEVSDIATYTKRGEPYHPSFPKVSYALSAYRKATGDTCLTGSDGYEDLCSMLVSGFQEVKG